MLPLESLITKEVARNGDMGKYFTDDFERKLDKSIKDIVKILADIYKQAFNGKKTTSVSNFFKSDLRYYNEILPKFSESFDYNVGEDLKQNMDIFRR